MYDLFSEISVMSLRRKIQKMHSFVLIGGLILCLLLTIQLKQIYENNQKHNRYLGYKQYIEEISVEMNVVERSANKSSAYVRQLNEALLKHRENELKNITMSRTIIPL